MFNIFRKKEPTQIDITFLTTQGINYHLEKMFLDAEEFICIVAPYIQIKERLRSILTERATNGISISIVCRRNKIQEDLSLITEKIYDNKQLHAKCYITEKCALVGSLNLYDFSQINNDEMGFLIKNQGLAAEYYSQIKQEIIRIAQRAQGTHFDFTPHTKIEAALRVGQPYSTQELNDLFDFEYKGNAGIKTSPEGHIALFNNSKGKYINRVADSILHFHGQNTGQGEQKLLYGNKALYDAFSTPSTQIYLFHDGIYQGTVRFASAPYQANGAWFFPLNLP